nr:hypothetical protein [uncultured Cellulosilyticum sp.]
MARISITIDPQLKIDLEHMAKANFRTLNGEINKALNWYVKNNLGEVVEPQREILTTPTHIVEPLSHTQTQVPVASINIKNNIYDEIEEF